MKRDGKKEVKLSGDVRSGRANAALCFHWLTLCGTFCQPPKHAAQENYLHHKRIFLNNVESISAIAVDVTLISANHV